MFYTSLFARIFIYTASGNIFSAMYSCTSTANEYTYFSWIHFTRTLRPFALFDYQNMPMA